MAPGETARVEWLGRIEWLDLMCSAQAASTVSWAESLIYMPMLERGVRK